MRFARWGLLLMASLAPLCISAPISPQGPPAGEPAGRQPAAQLDYITRFEMEKPQYLLGEPIFTKFSIRNTGRQTFQFVFRSPSRALNRELESEPSFRVTDAAGRALPDPAPTPCGGASGTVVYGSVTLPPGQTHTERWLVNQWARFSAPGSYHLRAERRLPLQALDPRTQEPSGKPSAYALALNELSFEVAPATEAQLRSAFRPFLETLRNAKDANPAVAVLVITTLPKAFFLTDLESMASQTAAKRWDRRAALEGLARLGTPAAWQAILRVAQGKEPDRAGAPARAVRPSAHPPTGGRSQARIPPPAETENSLRAYAILLLAEKADPAFLPALLDLAAKGPEALRDGALRALGFFQDPRAVQALYQKLHSENITDRMNAILGLKNLGTRETLPALMAMLNDPAPQVRQVANYALQGLTGQKFKLSEKAGREESARVAAEWHAWWQEKGGNFTPPRLPPCREW